MRCALAEKIWPGLEREKARAARARSIPGSPDEKDHRRGQLRGHDRRSFGLHEMVYSAPMNWLLITAALACNPGDRLVDLTRRMLRRYERIKRWEQTDDIVQNVTMRLYRTLEAVTPQAQLRIRRAAELYIMRNPALAERVLRFDVMVVTPWSWPRHIVDAWRDY